MSIEPELVVVDAFADAPFAGNPAAVCLLPGPVDERWMRGLAREMNLSETAFLRPDPDVPGGYMLRWLTPTVEVDLCGHATLASAHALWEWGCLPPGEPARFSTRSGPLSATRGEDGWITLDFPAKPVLRPVPPIELDALGSTLGATIVSGGWNAFDTLLELESEEAVRGLAPDFGRLSRFPVRGVIATARASTPGIDFVSRFFAPAAGVDEDPVTGSAHCCLGPFWAERFGRTDFVAYQASARGGVVRVSVRGDRVMLGGRAITIHRPVLAPAARPASLA